MLIGTLTLALIYLVYYFSRSIAFTAVCSIAIILIMRSLQPYFTLLGNKLFPKPPIKTMRELNMGKEAGRGVRILLVSEFTDFDPANDKSVDTFDNIVADAVEALRQSKPLFELRYSTVCEKQLPMQYCFSVCGEKSSGMRRCFRTWLKAINVKDFGSYKADSEFFIYDGQFNDPVTGELSRSAVLFLFDSRLPGMVGNRNKKLDASTQG